MASHRIAVTLPDPLFEAVVQAARRRGLSRSTYVASLLAATAMPSGSAVDEAAFGVQMDAALSDPSVVRDQAAQSGWFTAASDLTGNEW